MLTSVQLSLTNRCSGKGIIGLLVFFSHLWLRKLDSRCQIFPLLNSSTFVPLSESRKEACFSLKCKACNACSFHLLKWSDVFLFIRRQRGLLKMPSDYIWCAILFVFITEATEAAVTCLLKKLRFSESALQTSRCQKSLQLFSFFFFKTSLSDAIVFSLSANRATSSVSFSLSQLLSFALLFSVYLGKQ